MASAPKFSRAPVRQVEREDCDFYHTVDLPGGGTVHGQWDFRGRESAYLGGVDFGGKSVLEIGPASGCLGFWMERQGASVTAFDLGVDQQWDFVPFRGVDLDAQHAARRAHLQRLHNSWWYLRGALNSKAEVVYGTVYDIEPALGSFDVVTLNSILLHLRDPLRAIERAASVCAETIVIADVAEEQFWPRPRRLQRWLNRLFPNPTVDNSRSGPPTAMSFIPRADNPEAIDAWFFLPSTLVAEMLEILGFQTTITKHRQAFETGEWSLYTVVGKRRLA